MIEVIGFLAAVLTTVAFLPQAIQVIRTRSTNDLSPIMYALFVSGVVLWLVYGVLLNNTALILANSITAVLAGIVFYFVIANEMGKRRG